MKILDTVVYGSITIGAIVGVGILAPSIGVATGIGASTSLLLRGTIIGLAGYKTIQAIKP